MKEPLTPGIRPSEPPPFYELDSLTFEELCRDLFDTESSIATCEIYGDPGQTQDGIDLLAHRKGGDGIEVGQCKCYKDFPPSEIRAVSDKFFEYWENHWSKESVKRFILFVASDLKTRQRQDEIANQKKRFAQHGIEYEAWSSAKIRNALRPYPSIVSTYCHPTNYWVPIICGVAPPPVPSFATPDESSVVNSFITHHIDEWSEWLSDGTELHLEIMRESSREGTKAKALQWLRELRNDHGKWSVLSQDVRAKLLSFEGGIELNLTGKISRAKELADQADGLARTSNVARLRAMIAFKENKLEEAIQYLTNQNDTDSAHLKAALFLDMGDVHQCGLLLESEIIVSNSTAETYRLRALFYLVTKELRKAQLEIQKATELKSKWESIKFASALINYFSALSPAAFPNHITIAAEPIDWARVKRDDESLSRLRRATDLFQELAELPDKSQEDKQRVYAWKLACLANDPERQEDAMGHCLLLLKQDPSFTPAISWALARNYDINLEASVSALQKLVLSKTASIHHIFTLALCYLASDKSEEAIKLLESTQTMFQKQQAYEAWFFAFSQAQIHIGSPETVLEHFEDPDKELRAPGARILALSAMARKTGDWRQLDNYLEQSYEETGNPSFLLTRCELKAQLEDWLFIVEHSETLLQCFETAEVFRLITVSAYNAEHFSQCLQLLDNYRHLFPESKLPSDLRRMRALCNYAIGGLPEAIREAKTLASEEPSVKNLLILINFYARKGDLKGVALVARGLREQSDLPIEQTLRLARLLQWEDRQLAINLWEKALAHELPDHLVGEALFLGNQLGVGATALKSLYIKLHELGLENRGGIHFGPAREIIDLVKQANIHGAKIDEMYRHGKVPIHFVAQAVNASLAMLYHFGLAEHEKSPDPLRQFPLLARHGGRIAMAGFPTITRKLNLHLDITSVLLAKHLNILSKVEQAFAPLYIPSELIPALIQVRERITHHQPLRLQQLQQVVDLTNQGLIKVLDQELPTKYDNSTLLKEMGANWINLAEAARANNGYIVDHLPLTKNDLSGEYPSSLPEDIEQYMVNCRAIVESLRQQGPLSDEEYRTALDALGGEGQKTPSKIIPDQGNLLFCEGAVPEILAEAKLLSIVCERFQVYIVKDTFDMIQNGLENSTQMRRLAKWVDSLTSRLTIGLDKGYYRQIVIHPNKRKKLRDFQPEHPLDGCLAALLSFEMKEGDIIWTDDRYFNSHQHRDGIPIADIFDILKLLVGTGELSKAEYYRTIYKLRAANVIFIPVQQDEIVYRLKQAHFDGNKGGIIETQQLKILRQYIASCLLRKNMMQVPPMSEGSPNELGESAFIINLMRAITRALFDIWTDNDADEEICHARREWIIENMYLDSLTIAQTTGMVRANEDQDYQITLGFTMLLTAPFATTTNNSHVDATSRRNYFTWLYERLLQRRFDADPQLLSGTVEILKRTFQEIKQETQQNETSTAVDLFFQTYYDDLPKPVQDELHRDEDFMISFGLEFIKAVTIEDLAFKSDDFFRTAHKAINGNDATIAILQSKEKIVFEPIDGELAFCFTHPVNDEEVSVGDEHFILLMDSPIERETALYRHKKWFDCSEPELKQAVAAIASTEDIVQRVRLANEWKESSTAIHYHNLYHQLREHQQINLPNLIPPSADRLLSHYRLTSLMSSEKTFRNALTTASETLLQEEGLGITIHRIVGFPTPLPSPVLVAISALSETEKTVLIRKLLKMGGSPLSQMHLLRILIQLGEQKPAYYRLARRIIKSIFTEGAVARFAAFSAVLRWVNLEVGCWKEANNWQPDIRLAMVWAHAHQLFSIFMAVGVPTNWVLHTFNIATRRVSPELLDRNLEYWLDIAHPNRGNLFAFVLMGLAYSINQKGEKVIDHRLQDSLSAIAFRDIDGTILPVSPLLRDTSRASNALESFLGGEYAKKLASLFGNEKASTFGSAKNQILANQAIDELSDNPDNLTAWFILQVTIDNLPPYETLKDHLTYLLRQTQHANLFQYGVDTGLATIEFSAMQLIHLASEELHLHLREQLAQIFNLLAQRDWEQSAQNINFEQVCSRLIEIVLNIAICNLTMERKILEFRDMLAQLVETWPATVPIVKQIVQVLYEELPVKQGHHFGTLLIHLRAS